MATIRDLNASIGVKVILIWLTQNDKINQQ